MDALQQRSRQWGGRAVTAQKPRAPRQRTLYEGSPKGHRTDRIEGSYRTITVHQLSLVWWLHASGHLTRRQLRVYFALHEMAERRNYAQQDRQPLYRIREVLHLVGGRGDEAKARSELSGDLRRLAELGLADLSAHHIEFARSADQIRIDDLGGFWTMLQDIPNARRTVPVPRRMVRALAAGFSRSVTALVLALLIRGLFWHKQTNDYRTDGRYKLSWVSGVFGVSRRSVTEARATLIELGWIEPLKVNQILMNRYGLHDRIVPEWNPPANPTAVGGLETTRAGEPANTQPNDQHQKRAVGKEVGEPRRQERANGAGQGGPAGPGRVPGKREIPSGGSATPTGRFSGGSASLDLTDSLPLTGNQNTRTPAHPARPDRAGPAGVSLEAQQQKGSRKEKPARRREAGAASQSEAHTESKTECRRGGAASSATPASSGARRKSSNRANAGSRRSRSGGAKQRRRLASTEPNIRDVQPADLASTDRLLELHRQAVKIGLVKGSEAARLDFLSLAERARTRGKRAGALFFWLLREKKTAFITHTDEDRAARRLREHYNGPREIGEQWGGDSSGGAGQAPAKAADPISDQDRFVVACIRAAKKAKIEPFRIAQHAKQWTIDQWDNAYLEYTQKQWERQKGKGQAESG